MTTFAFLVLCVQACLFQHVYSQCIGRAIQPAVSPVFNIPSCASALIPAYAPACTPGYASPAVYAPAAYAVTVPGNCGCTSPYF